MLDKEVNAKKKELEDLQRQREEMDRYSYSQALAGLLCLECLREGWVND